MFSYWMVGWIVLGVLAAVVVVLARKNKPIPKPQEMLQGVEYHKRYPKRSQILEKKYLMEDHPDSDKPTD